MTKQEKSDMLSRAFAFAKKTKMIGWFDFNVLVAFASKEIDRERRIQKETVCVCGERFTPSPLCKKCDP